MKGHFRFLFLAVLSVNIGLFSGCASFWKQPSEVSDQEHWQEVHDSLHDWTGVDTYGNPKSH
jgi:hypothetical protein